MPKKEVQFILEHNYEYIPELNRQYLILKKIKIIIIFTIFGIVVFLELSLEHILSLILIVQFFIKLFIHVILQIFAFIFNKYFLILVFILILILILNLFLDFIWVYAAINITWISFKVKVWIISLFFVFTDKKLLKKSFLVIFLGEVFH